jgi:hypothetical protein
MMRLGRRATLLVALSLLTSAATRPAPATSPRLLIWKDRSSSGCLDAVDLSVDIDTRESLAGVEATSRGRRRLADDGTAATTNQADMRGLPVRAEPHDAGSSGAASV